MLLAEGTYGYIYNLGRGIVMKKYKNGMTGVPGDFIREVSALKSVKSPYVIEVLDVDDEGIQLPYYEHSLYSAIKKKLPYNTKEILRSICLGLYELHSIGIVHSDVKPGNIMLKSEHEACIIDTGFSKMLEVDRNYGKRDMKIMTFYYRAPEVFLQEKYGFEIDIWSVGCTFVEMLEQEILFPIRNEEDILTEHFKLMGTPSYVLDEVRFSGQYRERFSNYGEEICYLIGGMLNTDYRDRFFLCDILNSSYLRENVKNERLKYGNYLDDYVSALRLEKIESRMIIMRKILLLWLISILDYFELHDSIYFRTVALIDKLIAMSVFGKVHINEENFQLIGLCCLFISSKYETSSCLTISDILSVSEYSRKELLHMEKRILKILDWNVCFPTLYNYVSLYSYDLTLTKEQVKIFLKSLYICTIYSGIYEWDYAIICILLGYIITNKILARGIDPLNQLTEQEQDTVLSCREFLLDMDEFDEISALKSLI
jgi:serine/threonine protein kinase